MAVNTKDKYYTPDWLVEHTIKKAIEIIGKENIREIVEPSAGDGAFIEPLKKAFPDLKQRYYDLYPEHPEVIEQNYKEVRLTYKKGRLTIGNPPFGASSSLWKAFCRKAATNSDYIVFISPASQYNSNYYFKEGELVYSELFNDVEYRGSETEGGKATKVRTCLNIYKVYDREGSEDWRLQRLEQDVLIKIALFRNNEWRDKHILNEEYDLYVNTSYHINYIETCDFTKLTSNALVVKILNSTIKEKALTLIKKYIDDKHYVSEKSGYMSGFTVAMLKEYLISHLYPTREERLEQDVKIHTILKHSNGWYEDRGGIREEDWQDYDYFITYWGEYAGDVSLTPVSGGSWGVKILNEPRRTQIEEALYKVKDEYNRTKGEERTMNMTIFKSILVRLLYPTREERLEQDVLITHNNNDYDYILGRRGNGYIGRLLCENSNGDNYSIKVLNENIREKLEHILYNIRDDYKQNKIVMEGTPNITLPFLKEYLIKHLYPTREERLEQDVLIGGYDNRYETNMINDYDYFISLFQGQFSERIKNNRGYLIKVLNKEKREQVKNALIKFYDYRRPENDSSFVRSIELKEYLIRTLYSGDPSFDSYDIYPEVKKPIHVERAQFAKALF